MEIRLAETWPDLGVLFPPLTPQLDSFLKLREMFGIPQEIQNLNSPVCGIAPGNYTVGLGMQANSEMVPKMLDGYGTIQCPWLPSLS